MGQSYGRSHGRIEHRLFERIIEVCTSKKWLTKHGTKEITYEASRTLNRGAWFNGEIEDFMDQFSFEESRRLVMGKIELKEGHHYSGHEFIDILENRRRWNEIINPALSASDHNTPERDENLAFLREEWREVEKDIRKGKAEYYSCFNT